jgi:hypothetical protein
LPAAVKPRWGVLFAVCGCFGAGLLGSPSARGETDACGDPTRPWILVDFGAVPSRDPVPSEVTRQLRAGLSKRGIDVCTDAPEPGSSPLPARAPPMATLVFGPVDQLGVALTLEVRDAITAKRVEREVDLRTIPPDGRALVLAVEADELLRATWAELAMKDAKPAVVPPAVRRAVDASILEAPPLRGSIGLRGTVERFTGGLTLFGGDVRSEYWLASRWGGALALGYRVTPAADVALGRVSADALHGGAGGMFALTPRDRRLGLVAVLSLDAFAVSFSPRANPGAVATAVSDWAATAGIAVAGWVAAASRLRFGWEAGVAIPLRSVEATSSRTEDVESSKGVGLVGSIDAALCF